METLPQSREKTAVKNGGVMLEVKDLSVVFERETVLQNISFNVLRGEALAIIGPNGAGKTVLFRALLGLAPHKGEIRWREGTSIGYVPQKFMLDRALPLSVKEFFLLKSRRFWFPERRFLSRLPDELASTGLSVDILKKPVSELSTGQFQRLLISWAMLNHPDVLLFDEPTSGIDVGFEETIYTLLHRLRKERNTTILLISHDLDIVYRYAEQVLCLNKQMVCHGRPKDVLHPQELAELYGEGGFYTHVK